VHLARSLRKGRYAEAPFQLDRDVLATWGLDEAQHAARNPRTFSIASDTVRE
jgi:hypothetical protein